VPKPKYRFDEEEANRAVSFFEKVLKHTEGRWAGTPFILTPWQRDDIIRPLFGWQRYDTQYKQWVRKYSKAYLELGRGNGKSELAAGLVLQGLVADGEYGAEVYGGAEDRDQAKIVGRVVMEMVNFSPLLKARLKVIESRNRIVDPKTNSFYQVLPRDRLGTGSQGFKLHRGVVDEYHVLTSNAFVDTIKRGMGKRVQPMIVLVTTAGNDINSPCAIEHEYADKILRGVVDDPSYFAYIRNTPKDADPWDEANWYDANPALGDFLSLETLRQEALEARSKPSEENSFRQYRLNQWVQQHTRWLSSEAWDASAGMVVEDKLQGPCFGGLDASHSTGIASLCWDFGRERLWRFFLPEDRLPEADEATGAQAGVWAREGHLKLTPGNVTDYAAIKSQIEADSKTFDVKEIGYNSHAILPLINELTDAGFQMVPISQGITTLSGGTKELERQVLNKEYVHGGNPVTRWMVDGLVVRTNSDGNIKPDKEKSKVNISGVTAAVMALDRRLRVEAEPQASIYEGRGMVSI